MLILLYTSVSEWYDTFWHHQWLSSLLPSKNGIVLDEVDWRLISPGSVVKCVVESIRDYGVVCSVTGVPVSVSSRFSGVVLNHEVVKKVRFY